MDSLVQHSSIMVNGVLDWCSCLEGASGKEHDPANDKECLLSNKEEMEIYKRFVPSPKKKPRIYF
ncbi:hypothetical protein MarSH_086 [Marseillevirus Shanghai 1]|nr:hypothetical protein MarSH_086 [Marseillevirus Shanghai 1]